MGAIRNREVSGQHSDASGEREEAKGDGVEEEQVEIGPEDAECLADVDCE